MAPVGGPPLLHRLVEQFRKEPVKEIVVIRGFGKEEVNAPDVRFVDNDEHADTGELFTLYRAKDSLKGELVISYGDILFRRYILSSLLDIEDDIAIAVDAAWQERASFNGAEDLVKTSAPHSLKYSQEKVWLERMDPAVDKDGVDGEWIGLFKTSAKGSEILARALDELSGRDDFRRLHLFDLFNHLIEKGVKVRVLFIAGHWLDVDNLDDLSRAQTF
jgi:phosphoenolpyruvate phosphomutase